MSILFMFPLHNPKIIALSYTFIVDQCITVNLSDKYNMGLTSNDKHYEDLTQGFCLPSLLFNSIVKYCHILF
jgi:hypothetical protein